MIIAGGGIGWRRTEGWRGTRRERKCMEEEDKENITVGVGIKETFGN